MLKFSGILLQTLMCVSLFAIRGVVHRIFFYFAAAADVEHTRCGLAVFEFFSLLQLD